jgi:biofilm PGA synthesis N-glycosyltransferase PgaC
VTSSYVVVTPASDEAANLPRLAAGLVEQGLRPEAWVVVVNGSRDGTLELAQELAATTAWIEIVELSPSPNRRGGAVVRAFNAGMKALGGRGDVVVKLDADVSFASDYFETLISSFDADPTLGIASGNAWELEGGLWKAKQMTEGSVWGASRAYRRTCLEQIGPLEEEMGWDGLDQLKANMNGWSTKTLSDLPFRHHRAEGERDGNRRRAWTAQGRGSRFMGYRPSYLVCRAFWRAREERAALWMIWGFAAAAARREPRCSDEAVRAYLRRRQRIRELSARRRELASDA